MFGVFCFSLTALLKLGAFTIICNSKVLWYVAAVIVSMKLLLVQVLSYCYSCMLYYTLCELFIAFYADQAFLGEDTKKNVKFYYCFSHFLSWFVLLFCEVFVFLECSGHLSEATQRSETVFHRKIWIWPKGFLHLLLKTLISQKYYQWRFSKTKFTLYPYTQIK